MNLLRFLLNHGGWSYKFLLRLLLSFSLCLCHNSVNGIAYQDIPAHTFFNTTSNYDNYDAHKMREQIAVNRQFLTRKGRESFARKQDERNLNLQISEHQHQHQHQQHAMKLHEERSLQSHHQKSRTNRIRGKQRYYQHRYQQRELAVDSTGPVLNVLVCLMQWTNHPDRNTAIPVDDHRNLFNGDGRDPTLFPGGTVSDYFKTMSYGDFQIKFEVTDWIMTDYTEQQFTADGSQGRTQELQEAFAPVLQYLDDDYFDFGSFDANFDRKIDLTVFLHSGYEGVDGGDDCETGATSQQRIASHARAGADESTWVSAGGYKLGPYAVAPAFRGICDLQIGRIGTIVHEMIHTFGLPEMYDVEGNYGTGNLGGIDRFGVMANAAGNSGGDYAWPGHLGAWSRFQLGWVDPIVIDKGGTYELRPVEQYPDVYKITKGFSNPKEYLLIENRQSIAGDFDEKFFTPGGIIIYHVDENNWDVFKNELGPVGNYPRGGPFLEDWPGNGKHYPVAILQADGLYELEQGINGGQSADLWNNNNQVLGPGNGEKIAKMANYPNTDSYAFGLISPTGITIQNFQMKPDGSKTMTFQICLDDDDCSDSESVGGDGGGGLADTKMPTNAPTKSPTVAPTIAPTNALTAGLTTAPTRKPTSAPTAGPTLPPTDQPQLDTTNPPTFDSVIPGDDVDIPIEVAATVTPTKEAITKSPSKGPSKVPTKLPTKELIDDNIFLPAPIGDSFVPNPSSNRPSVAPQVELLSNGSCDIAATVFSSNNAIKEISNTNDGGYFQTCYGTERQGVWYTLEAGSVPPNEVVQANTCFAETKIVSTMSVFRGGNCSTLECVETDSISCKNGELGQVTYWSAEPQEDYYLFVYPVDNADVDVDKLRDGSLFLSVLNYPQVLNDDCDTAIIVSIDGTAINGVTEGARPDMNTTDAPCGIESAGVWYKVTGTGSSLRATTCLPGTNHPTQIHVLSGSCGNLMCISVEADNFSVCSNLDIPTNSATVNWNSEEGIEYFVLVGSRDGSVGDFELVITEFDSVMNDQCSDAIDISPNGSQISGSTQDATNDFPYDGKYCGLPLETAGVWYVIEGTGDGMSFSTCPGNDYNSAISIFTGSDCNNLQCLTGVATRDPSCDYAGVTTAWLSQKKETYYIYVHGSALNSYGTFEVVAEEFDVIEPNEFCHQALPVLESESFIQGSTEDATHTAPTNSCGGVEVINPGLWYTLNGTGYPYEISACARDDTGLFDVSVSLFSGDDCGDLKCVSGYTFTDQPCSTGGEGPSTSARFLQNSPTSLGSTFLDSKDGTTYYVFVHGQNPSSLEDRNRTKNGVGDFDLIIRSQIPPAVIKEVEVDEFDKNNKSEKNLKYLYLLLLLLLVIPLWFLRKISCSSLPCFKDKDELDPGKPTDADNIEETPFQDETLPRTSNIKISEDPNNDDSDDDSKSGSKMESIIGSHTITSPSWQTLD